MHIVTCSFLVLTVFLPISWCQTPAPDPTNPYLKCPFHHDDPCECSFQPGVTSIVCRYVPNGETFSQMMNKTRQENLKDIETLFLHFSNVTLPYPHLFDQLPFKRFYITQSRIDSPPEQSAESLQPIFRGLEDSVEEIVFQNTTIRFVEENCVLGALPHLRRLSLVAANISIIPAIFFCCSYTKLEEVYLNQNHITTLNKGVLSRAMSLSLVMLNHNKISILERLFFPFPAENLTELHLRYNSLQTLPNDLFTKMPSLKFVDLAHNQLKYLPETLWKPLWRQFSDVYLDHNDLVCDCALEWLPYQDSMMNSRMKHQRMMTGQCHRTSNNTLHQHKLEELDVAELSC